MTEPCKDEANLPTNAFAALWAEVRASQGINRAANPGEYTASMARAERRFRDYLDLYIYERNVEAHHE